VSWQCSVAGSPQSAIAAQASTTDAHLEAKYSQFASRPVRLLSSVLEFARRSFSRFRTQDATLLLLLLLLLAERFGMM